jgi:kinesin family protein C1
MFQNEAGQIETPAVRIINSENVEVIDPDEEENLSFEFNSVFMPGVQKVIFNDVADLVQSCIDGYTSSIFAYGQTGSGKTHTMYGTPQDPGIVPRTGKFLFDSISQCDSSFSTYEVFGSSFEIHNSKLNDLYPDKSSGGAKHHVKPINVSWDQTQSW